MTVPSILESQSRDCYSGGSGKLWPKYRVNLSPEIIRVGPLQARLRYFPHVVYLCGSNIIRAILARDMGKHGLLNS